MRYQNILTILLAAVVAIQEVTSLLDSKNQTDNKVDEKELILNSIMTRSSVRKYNDQHVSDETIEKILRAAMSAPTAGNRQPWEFYVVRDTTIIRQFPKVTKFSDPMAQEASVVIVACGVPSEAFPIEPRYWVQDVSSATENILLSAHALGLGAVWSGVYPGEERVATLRELLNVPDKLIPFNIIFMGYPDGEAVVKDKWKPEKIHYIVGE